jgi:hypothetical protein
MVTTVGVSHAAAAALDSVVVGSVEELAQPPKIRAEEAATATRPETRREIAIVLSFQNEGFKKESQ